MTRKTFATLLSAFFVFHSALAGEKPRAAVSESAILKKYSLEQLDSAALLLMGSVDHPEATAQDTYCHIPTAEAGTLLLALHPLIDTQVANRTRRKPKSGSNLPPDWRTCRKTCHCGIYSVLLEKSARRLRPSEKSALKELREIAKSITSDDQQACVRETQWFCGSDLLVFLRKVAPEYEAPASSR